MRLKNCQLLKHIITELKTNILTFTEASVVNLHNNNGFGGFWTMPCGVWFTLSFFTLHTLYYVNWYGYFNPGPEKILYFSCLWPIYYARYFIRHSNKTIINNWFIAASQVELLEKKNELIATLVWNMSPLVWTHR